MKCARIGEADTFQKIIFAFASEDADVRLNELGTMMKSSGATGKRKILIVEDGIETELACLDLGAADFITKPYNSDIIRRRIRNVIRLKESSLTLEAVERDELTGLYTEQAFLHYVKQIMSFKPNKKMHLIIGKIKDFNLINSIYGTKKADEYLCYLASA